ncbi:hypothetical protein LZ318_30920 [Saccharopolyspora indica]|uniref:hypothetical protein n=1 Tax=Saccharopolyspora indica TaxID=1229659 RepID=UPI0022EA45AD|nr:hypothetical protein [Saccharopolyspora indica]MDA3644354.1 hypothetical protein [Saccharopolyspora indica]
MRSARIIFRAEGARRPRESDPLPVMFDIDLHFRPATAEQCAPLAEAIRRYLAGPHGDRQVERIWFSVPEALERENMSQEIVVDGGTSVEGNRLRFRAELHHAFCHCGWCRQENAYQHLSVWI